MRVSQSGNFYHPAPVCDWGLLSSNLAVEIGEFIQMNGDEVKFKWGDQTFTMKKLD